MRSRRLRRLRRLAFVAAVATLLGMVSAPASAAPSMSVSVASWTRSEPQGLLTYDFTISSGDLTVADSPCRSYCKYNVSGYYFDGTTYRFVHQFGQNTDWKVYPSLTLRYAAADAAVREITHLRAYMWNGSNQTIDSGYVQVDTPRTHSLTLSVANWARNDTTGTLTYDFTVTGRNLWAESSPCKSHCQYLVALYYPNGTTNVEMHRFGSSGGWYMYRALDLRYTRTDAVVPDGTLLRAYLWDGATPARTVDTGYLEVDSPRAAALELRVDKWEQDNSAISYDLTVDGTTLWAYGSLCRSYCRWRVEGLTSTGSVVALASDSLWRLYPSLHLHRVGSATSASTVQSVRVVLTNGSFQELVADVAVTGNVTYSVSVAEAVAVLEVATEAQLAKVCDELLFMPGTHNEGTSTSDQYNQCERLRRLRQFAKLVAFLGVVGGGALIAKVVMGSQGDENVEDTQPSPSPTVPSTTPIPQSIVDAVADHMLARTPRTTLLLTETDVQTTAKKCIEYVSIAMSALDPSVTAGAHPCLKFAIFLPGSEVESATQHDYDAIFVAHSPDGGPAHREWLMLNYVPAATKVGQGFSRDWYNRVTVDCGVATPTAPSCDEYPYFASAQGGNTTPLPSLRRVDKTHNELEGSRYGGFIRSCKLQTAQPFLVIPMAWDNAPTSKAVCR